MGRAVQDLETWLEPFLPLLGHKMRRSWALFYLRGLLGPSERKSLQPMAACLGLCGHDQLRHFVAGPAWDALASHPVGQRHHLLVAEMRADQIAVIHLDVIDIAAKLHLGPDLLDHIAFLQQIVPQVDAGDLGEGAGQSAGLVFMGRDRIRHHIDVLATEGLRGADEEFHLLHLLVTGEGGGLEFLLHPTLRSVPGRSRGARG